MYYLHAIDTSVANLLAAAGDRHQRGAHRHRLDLLD
jgi:hypothetical protein